jgi:hypothetical protein
MKIKTKTGNSRSIIISKKTSYYTQSNPPKPSPHPLPSHSLQLKPQQIPNHLPARNPRRRPQRREIQRRRERIRIPKEQHRRDPAARVLERKARRFHLVLLDLAAAQMVHRAGGVDFGLEVAGGVGELGPRQDVEVVVGRVAAGVAFGSDGGAEDDEVFGYACGGFVSTPFSNYDVSKGNALDLLAWITYMAPMAPPALLKIHSCSRFTYG